MTVAHSKSLESIALNLSHIRFTDEQFYQLCLHNPERSFELTSQGELIVMSPVGGGSGKREASIISQLYHWNEQTGKGEVFSSSTIFKLPLGGNRSPDVAWVERSRWEALTPEEQEEFPPLAPDFVIELRSRTDILADLQAKMVEYRENGVRLGVLINRQDQQVELYRPGQAIEVLQSPISVNCEEVLAGFTLDLQKIW
jgi:Uma2 family endonuclease